LDTYIITSLNKRFTKAKIPTKMYRKIWLNISPFIEELGREELLIDKRSIVKRI